MFAVPIRRAALTLLPVILLTGCDGLMGLWGQRPPSIVERDGLSYQVVVTRSPYTYDAYEYRVRVTNTSWGTVERRLPADLATPRIYRSGEWSRPVWDPCGWGCGGSWQDVRIRLRQDEAVEGWGGQVYTRDFARSGYGRYYLVLVIDTGRDRFEVLGIPEIRVH